MNINVDELTLGQIKQIQALVAPATTERVTTTAFVIGKCYFIRTATYHVVGRLVAIHPEEFVLEEAAWVADSGRFNEALNTGDLSEVEPFIDPVIVFRGGCIDATEWRHPLPRSVK